LPRPPPLLRCCCTYPTGSQISSWCNSPAETEAGALEGTGRGSGASDGEWSLSGAERCAAGWPVRLRPPRQPMRLGLRSASSTRRGSPAAAELGGGACGPSVNLEVGWGPAGWAWRGQPSRWGMPGQVVLRDGKDSSSFHCLYICSMNIVYLFLYVNIVSHRIIIGSLHLTYKDWSLTLLSTPLGFQLRLLTVLLAWQQSFRWRSLADVHFLKMWWTKCSTAEFKVKEFSTWACIVYLLKMWWFPESDCTCT
jgi:hypothetical protein